MHYAIEAKTNNAPNYKIKIMTGTSFIPIIAVAIVVMRKRILLNKFKNSYTTTEKNAKTLNELKISRRFFFNRFVNNGVIIEVNSKYYLDEQNLAEYKTKRRMILIPVVIILLMLVIFIDIIST